MQDVVNQFPVGKEANRFGVIQYSTEAEIEFSFSKYDTNKKVLKALEKIKYQEGYTRTERAINLVINEIKKVGVGEKISDVIG